MKRAYYLFNPGRMSRQDNTLKFEPTGTEEDQKPRFLPVEGVSALYIFGSVDANSALYNFLGRKHIPVHFFDYYEHYTGTFSPREHLLAGQMLVNQTNAYRLSKRRLHLAAGFVEGATFNMLKNLKYYQGRGKELEYLIEKLGALRLLIGTAADIPELMGIEGNCRQLYYEAFPIIVPGYAWEGRSKRPPTNELNALVSFGNSLCYSVCLDAIYNSQLNPTISFLHEPGVRRYSLALDVSEIFKPLLVDRLLFRMCNKRELGPKDFDLVDNACFLSERGRKAFVAAWEEKLKDGIQHRKLNRRVTYRHLLRLECYKIAKYVMKLEERYEPFHAWW
ncbi:type I-B CRISPR-associated endonuclease Cas1b [Neolewinella lacunae]|uniref:CRISPR-associated endonuclease Cas1 n=2 Tax=Neolewinella lacunae TaxID=1517758 RepID=A0A923PMG9_9BACT|nr:type I-B CRISPR-associated endonuclease Cas1b [Neolewinella lacunae]MBC6995150.1 type I-B CRISPR-associated endonuclease Cas1 [Neolewinella lacunae]MDN3634100.1 type I-B CRISPR-associated endonuclease Cas1b [Neolewinella lacunae]